MAVVKRKHMAVRITPALREKRSRLWAVGVADLAHKDWQLSEGSCWVGVGNISLYIQRTEEGVLVSMGPIGHEDEVMDLARCYASFEDSATLGGGPVR